MTNRIDNGPSESDMEFPAKVVGILLDLCNEMMKCAYGKETYDRQLASAKKVITAMCEMPEHRGGPLAAAMEMNEMAPAMQNGKRVMLFIAASKLSDL